ncbi:AAA family ATPase [Microcoleus sp. FACHB-1515]|uniref:AAA family ATPase n=1 Tax=Cyanophyceae TaxID=3028117 RepID=UPI0016865542|nr:AAA family ATPase [Microcoleus sp. FACHB-1515]MBD2093176.1 AAA family ATPase [Microcoleus sp. FACHB-1515]
MYPDNTNYEPLTLEQIRELQQLTPEQQQEWRDRQVEKLNREIYQQGETASIATAVLTAKRDPLREKSERELKTDILTAVKDSEFLRASLSQIARYNGMSIDVIETVAQQVASEFLNRDLEAIEFEEMTKRIQKIENSEKDAGIRDLKLHRLARRHGLNRRTMMECYSKSVCSASHIRAKPIGEFLDEHLQAEVKYLVQGWIPQGVTMMLHGDGGAGKTLWLYELMERILKGHAWSGYPCTKAEVLLVQVDEPETITAERIDIRGIDRSMPLKVMSDWQVEQMPKLEAEAAAMPPGSLILVDSLTAINRNCFYSENDTEYARPVLQMRDIARKYGHTVILVHHSNADGRARGTRAIHNSVDVVWALSATDYNERLLRIEKMRRGMPVGRYRLAFDDETFRFTYRGEEFESDEDFEKAQTYIEKIRLWLSDDAQRGRPFEPIEVSEALGGSKASTRRCLQELAMRGQVETKRKPGTPYYLYFVKKKQESDRAIGSDRLKAIATLPSQGAGFEPSDRAIAKKSENEREKTGDRPDRFAKNVPQTQTESEQNGDRFLNKSDRPVNNGDRPIALRNNPLPEKIAVGDTVLVTATAQWIRSGSDKLPWREVPQSQRNTPQIPINVLGQPLFDELIEGGKVIEIRGDRSRVRHQKTGRTSMFLNTDLRVLRSEDKS